MEQELISWLRQRFAGGAAAALDLQDDGAVLSAGDEAFALTTDLLCDGTHFVSSKHSPAQIGYKSLAANLSDLAAMAASPVGVLVSIAVSPTTHLVDVQQLYLGMQPLLERHATALLGGDTNRWDGPLAINVTAIGRVGPAGPLRRSEAIVGDHVLVTGRLGGSLCGWHLRFEPRVVEAWTLRHQFGIHAGLDISDGLALDASRLAAASQVGIELDLNAIPIAPAAEQLSRRDSRPALEHALSDGEDFELLFTAAADLAEALLRDQPLEIPITRIGTVVPQPGLWQRINSNRRAPLSPAGYLH